MSNVIDHVGKMYFSTDMVLSDIFPDLLRKLGFRPVRVEFLIAKNMFEYVGYSPLFDKADLGCQTPEYAVIVSEEDGILRVGVNLIE